MSAERSLHCATATERRPSSISNAQRRQPSSEQLACGDDVVWHRLVRDLVAQGERRAAIAYLERLARTSVAQRIELREWAAALRGDVAPI